MARKVTRTILSSTFSFFEARIVGVPTWHAYTTLPYNTALREGTYMWGLDWDSGSSRLRAFFYRQRGKTLAHQCVTKYKYLVRDDDFIAPKSASTPSRSLASSLREVGARGCSTLLVRTGCPWVDDRVSCDGYDNDDGSIRRRAFVAFVGSSSNSFK